MDLVYRYRPNSELSFKELKYNEILFSKLDELNDPMDGVIEYHFPNCCETWDSFCTHVWNDNGLEKKKNFKKAVTFLSRTKWERNELVRFLENSHNTELLELSSREMYLLKEAIESWTTRNIYPNLSDSPA